MNRIPLISILCILLSSISAAGHVLQNSNWKVEVAENGNMTVEHVSGAKTVFRPSFVLSYFEKSPKVSWDRIPRHGIIDNLNYRIIAWNKTHNIFDALNPEEMMLLRILKEDDMIEFVYADRKEASFAAKLTLPSDGGEPMLSFSLKALKDGSFSIGYTGAPEISLASVQEVWQPLVWTQKRFPADSYLTADFNCTMPLAAFTAEGFTQGVCVSPESFPFQPLPTRNNVRFGVALRNRTGQVQPMIWAPVAGMPASGMNAGDVFDFSMRLFSVRGSMMDTHESLAMELYGLSDYYRDNQVGSMNTALDNMIDYGMSQYSWFVEELKGSSYETDVREAVKNTTSLNALNLSLVTDREDIFDNRFMPVLEYMLSRENLLFSLKGKEGEGGQKSSSCLGTPVMPASEAIAIYDAGGRKSDFLIDEIWYEKAMRKLNPHERYWREQQSLYRATGERIYLDNAVKAADIYLAENIDVVQEYFDYTNQNSSSFWTSLSPKFPDLYNLYELTGEERFLKAAQYAARRYAQFIWMCPAIPGEKVTVNIGGVAPKQKWWGDPMQVPEESVDAWRLSEIGLHCECAATSGSHRGVFPVHYAAYMRRIAESTSDDFLNKIANWAIVGRYQNFPGYHINTARTTVYEKEDFPLRTHWQMNVNSMHYNHIWPQMSILLDYLVSDVEMKTDGKIQFPAIIVEAFANLGCRMYGHKPGRWFGNEVWLWMPQRLLDVSDPQLNYITARNEDGTKLYIAFSNQSKKTVKAQFKINQDYSCSARKYTVEVSPEGCECVIVDNAALKISFQDKMLSTLPGWKDDYVKDDYGRAMLLNIAATGKRVYAYVHGNKDEWKRVCMRYRMDSGRWNDILDSQFPFEFTIPVGEDIRQFEYQMYLVDSENIEHKGELHFLKK